MSDIAGAFAQQVGYCRALGSPLTAALLDAARADFEANGVCFQLLSDHRGDPVADVLALRLSGFLHERALSGAADGLAKFYPSCGGAFDPDDADAMWAAARDVLETQEAAARDFLRYTPQTNETARAAALLAGFSEVHRRTGLPLALNEIGASAGLNLMFDRYRYTLGDRHWGASDSPLEIAAEWNGVAPELVFPIPVADRNGCDIAPIDISDASARRRLEAYVWADMPERRARLLNAMAAIGAEIPRIARADAADWVAERLAHVQEGCVAVIFHSTMWSYLDAGRQERITQIITEAGARATPTAPIAWVRMETPRGKKLPILDYRLWDGGAEIHEKLAVCHPHGARVDFYDPVSSA